MKTEGKVKALQSEIVDAMKKWQKVEDASLASTGRIIEKTTNPIIRLTMEVIQRDSQMHYNVEKWVAESLQDATISLTPEELNGRMDDDRAPHRAGTQNDRCRGNAAPVA